MSAWTKERQREYNKEYHARPEVKERRRAYTRAYRAIPENRAKKNAAGAIYAKRKRDELRAADPEAYSRSRREINLRFFYKMTVSEYDAMFAAQHGVCAICSLPEMSRVTGRGRDGRWRLAIDHDHQTGKVRALLCVSCNHGIGALRENSELLRDAASYLERHAGGVA